MRIDLDDDHTPRVPAGRYTFGDINGPMWVCNHCGSVVLASMTEAHRVWHWRIHLFTVQVSMHHHLTGPTPTVDLDEMNDYLPSVGSGPLDEQGIPT